MTVLLPDGTEIEGNLLVDCDEPNCYALRDPQTFEEYRAAYEHWREHGYLHGCAHGN